MNKAVVKNVVPYSIADELGVEKGDIIEKIDGKALTDFLDFKFLTASDYYVITIIKKNGDIEEIEVYNDDFEEFGVEFTHQLIDDAKTCQNKCIFCFMDQLPKNMRSTMYFKDDDIRLSFLQGNYVTLTNLTEEEIKRVIDLKISPVNISVHVTDGERRKMMLNNRFADKLLDIMKDNNYDEEWFKNNYFDIYVLRNKFQKLKAVKAKSLVQNSASERWA